MHPGSLVQDRYLLDEPLGNGGMGEVWRAIDRRLDRPVALKLISPSYVADPEFLVRFFSEAQSVARVTHPHVIRVLDFGRTEDRPFLVMEFAEGGSLAEITGRPLTPERAAEIVGEAAQGAGAAHAQGIVHRDIKPANILLTEDGSPKITDFGIASSAAAEPLTSTGAAFGSPHYMSPEQAAGRRVDPRSDVYSLGVVLYELLTGKRPFDGDNVTAIAIAHVEKAPPAVGAVMPGVPEHLERIATRCLAKDPDERFSDGAELAAALSEGEGGTAPSAIVRLDHADPAARFTRRSMAILAAMLLGAALMIAGATWMAGTDESGRAAAGQSAPVRRPNHTSTPTPTISAAPMAPAPAATAVEKEEVDERTEARKEASPASEQRPTVTPSPQSPTSSPPPSPGPSPSPEESPQTASEDPS